MGRGSSGGLEFRTRRGVFARSPTSGNGCLCGGATALGGMDGLGESWEEESGESENGWRTPLAGCFVVGQFIGAWIIVIGVVRETCWGMGAGRMRIGVINGPSGRGVRDTGLVVRYSHQPVLRTMQELRGPLFFDHEFFCFGQVRPSAEYEGYDSDGGHVHVAGDPGGDGLV